MSGNQKAFELAMNQGHSAAWDQTWSQAAKHYRKALEEFPDHPMALNSLGLALFEMNEFNEALRCYLRAAQVAPDDPVSVEKIARIYEQMGRTTEAVQSGLRAAELHLKARNVEKAIESWQRVLSLQPENLMAHTRLALVFERMGRKTEAVSEYLASASLVQAAGDSAKALQIVEYCLSLIPNQADAQQALNLLRTNRKLPSPSRPRVASPIKAAEPSRLLEAPEEAESVKKLEPIAEARQKAMADLASLLFDQAEETDMTTSPETRRSLSALTRGTGQLQLGQAEKTRVLLHLGQAIESQSQGDDDQAAEELERALDIGMSHPAAHFDLGLLRAEKNGQRALRYLQKAVKNTDYSLASYLVMCQIYQREGNWPEAAAVCLQALRLADLVTVPASQVEELRQLYEPLLEELSRQTDNEAHKRLCENIFNQLLRPDWRSFLQTARQQLPSQPEGGPPMPLAEMLLQTNSSQIIESLASVRKLVNQKLYRSAMEESFRTMEYAPGYLPLHIQIGEILIREGRTEEAVVKFMLVAELYNLRGEAGQATALLSKVVQMAPMDLSVRNRLIELLSAQGQLSEAIKQTMDLANVYYHLAELDRSRQTYASALRMAQQAGLDRSWTVDILYKVADIDMQRLDLRQAARIFEQIRTLEPEEVKARVNLVNLSFRLGQEQFAMTEIDSFTSLLEHSGKTDLAIQFLEEVVAEQPDKADLLKRLSDLYVRNGQKEKAIEKMDVLADQLLAAGDKNGALNVLQTIVSLNPPNIASYKAALKHLQGG